MTSPEKRSKHNKNPREEKKPEKATLAGALLGWMLTGIGRAGQPQVALPSTDCDTSSLHKSHCSGKRSRRRRRHRMRAD